MNYYELTVIEQSEEVVRLSARFGEPAQNNLVVPDAIDAFTKLNLQGGPLLLFDGPMSLPVAMALAHLSAHLFEVVACMDPKLRKFVVAISHSPNHRPGDLLEGSS